MKRISKIFLKNMVRLPRITYQLYVYPSHPEKYSAEKRYNVLKDIVKYTKKSGHISIEVYGKENIPKQDGFIFYPNHQGIFDGFAMVEACPRPFRPVIKKELTQVPFVKSIFQCMGAMAMDREDPRQSLQTIQKVAEYIRNKENCLIFAEGTRSKNGNQTLPFKGGSFKPALKTKCPIVPVALIDSFLPFDKKQEGKVTVQVHILKPLYYEEYGGMKTNKIADEVRSRIEDKITSYSLPEIGFL